MSRKQADRFIKEQKKVLDEMKRVAKKAGKSVAQMVPWTPFEEAEPMPQLPDEQVFVNSRYQVCIKKRVAPPPFGKYVELSIKTRDREAFHDWRDFQRIKNELVGEEFEGLELYPAEDRLVDTANQYYMHVFMPQYPDGHFPFGYRTSLVAGAGAYGSKQRPFEVEPRDMMTEEDFKKFISKELRITNAGPAIPSRKFEEVAGRGDRDSEEDPPKGG